jgi:Tfp pilus assembly protein PilF
MGNIRFRHLPGQIFLLLTWFIMLQGVWAQSLSNSTASGTVCLVEIQGNVEVLPADTKVWTQAQVGHGLQPHDRVKTAANSRLALRWSDQSIVSFGASTELEVLPINTPGEQPGLHLIRGIISFFHRDQPGRIRVITRGAVAGIEGTEFVLAVDDADLSTLSVVDGKVKFSNAVGTLSLTNGEQAIAENGQLPKRTAGFIANNLLQWCFYYPAVIAPDELLFNPDEQTALAASLAAYRSGDLLNALAQYPRGRRNGSDTEQVYHAALLLSVGNVEPAESLLSNISAASERPQRLAAALREMIAAVKHQAGNSLGEPQLASEAMAASYYEQSHGEKDVSLINALRLAKQAATSSPEFGFAWERVAELEFSFGRMPAALTDLDKSLALSPKNAQAIALKGFVLSAQNRPVAARESFDHAIAVDAALGNAWLGRGLVRLRLGDAKGGREDLLIAAALEPQRAELRSYLGKAYAHTGDDAHAAKELALAKKLDPNDPTAWLYSTLVNQQNNQINEAIRDLEKSESLNDNRSVYRSQLLLDEDRAVRGANLAGMYLDAGMTDESIREAGRAVSSDYANYSAHLFLASSYEQLRDPNWSNLRYDTPASDEYWIANLLAPTGVGWLSSTITQPPYSRLFDQNHFGGDSETTYLGRGEWTEQADQYYTSGNLSYYAGTSYRYDPGQRPNNDFENREFDFDLKGQLTALDSIFAGVQLAYVNHGDNSQNYNNQPATDLDYRDSETQEPNLFLGYHHEWSPGVHTLFFATRRVADESASTTNAAQYIADFNGTTYSGVVPFLNSESVLLSPVEYSTELQQIWEQADHTTILGTRYGWGNVTYHNLEFSQDNWGPQLFLDTYPLIINQDFKLNFNHFNLYGYHNWQIADFLGLTAGLSYDYLHQPADVATAPFSNQEKTTGQFSPKAGLIWTPAANTTFRAAYTRSLSDFIDGNDYQLEPTEVAGFNQSFRSLVPESVAGDTSGSRFDTFDVSMEQKLATETYLGLAGQVLFSKLNELEGNFVFLENSPLTDPVFPIGLNKSINYRERSLVFTVDQLLGKQWAAGARYRLSQANLDTSYPDINPAILVKTAPSFHVRQNLDSVLQTVNLHANWNHPSGLFSVLEANWYNQSNSGFSPAEPGDDFWQFNVYAGYRFWHRRAELTVGLLNVADQNYRLEPLNLYNEMARSRTIFTRLRISF